MTPYIPTDTLDYAAYGVAVEIDNFEGILTYGLVSQVLGAVGAFLQQRKMCEVKWTFSTRRQDGRRGSVLGLGVIKKEQIIGESVTATENSTQTGSATA